jgi:hypothetical protein
MDVTAWNNGQYHSTGAGYGFKLNAKDRDANLAKSWGTVFVSLPGSQQEVEVDIAKPSFWSTTCRELISREFGRWLIDNGYAPWPSGAPPKFHLLPKGGNHFGLEKQ